jgi:pyruvate formate lyase activating enzyme
VLQTCGYGKTVDLDKLLRYTDTVMLDIKHMDPVLHKKSTGVDNELIKTNAELISKRGVSLYIRVPVVPGFNDNIESISRIVEFSRQLKSLKKVCLLQYHTLGLHKWKSLGKELPSVLARNMAGPAADLTPFLKISDILTLSDNISLL